MANAGLITTGFLSILLGLFFWAMGTRSRGVLKTKGAYISGAVWFVLVAFGIVLIAAGTMVP